MTSLTENDKAIIGECLNASVFGPFFDDWEFATLFGMTREDVAHIAHCWPDVEEGNSLPGRAVNNALNNLWGCPHYQEKRWSDFISVHSDEVRDVYERWVCAAGRDSQDG